MLEEQPPKIIIDDDWKSRVQAEKEKLRQEQAQDTAPVAKKSPDEKAEPESNADSAPLPPPTFPVLVGTLATEAMVALGQFPSADSSQPKVMLDQAKHFIDMLAMLEEKTKGNLTREESAMLENILHELRMAFVAVSSRK